MKRILLDLLSGLGASGNRDDERQLIDKIREFLHDKSGVMLLYLQRQYLPPGTIK
uniref:Uncharacterized protein n=2 Tax=Oryza sativa subsp. japonica TaxID=39947 RepID=Q2R7I2_ORYSJ|nr:hypothetical protein LOC_Os11g16500 [Oryza sativa Japonica Group]ABA92582.1 hypothetical protein LOC_Os11g16500 [Oryza sativa Japonica Group]